MWTQQKLALCSQFHILLEYYVFPFSVKVLSNVQIYSVFRWRKEVIRIQWVAANRILVIVQIKGFWDLELRILSHSTVRWVSHALIRFSFIGLLR